MSPAPTDDFLLLIHELAHLMRVRFDQFARRHDMTRAQWVILLRLERFPGLTQKELADAVEVEPMTVARLVDRLEASGHMERRPDPDDRRVWRLHLTRAAGPVLEEIGHVREQMLALLLGRDLSPQALAVTEATLRTMKANLSNESRAGFQPGEAAQSESDAHA